MTVKKTSKKKIKKTIKKSNKKRIKNSVEIPEKLRHVTKPRNYTELYRRTKNYHKYSFKLPYARALKKDITKIRNSETIKNLYINGQYTEAQIIKIIKRKAIDKAIDRKLSRQQKSAITRQWYGAKHKVGFKDTIKHVEAGEAIFIPIVNIGAKHQYDRAKRTNKGIFMLRSNVKATVINSGQNEYIKLDDVPSKDKMEEFGRQIRTRNAIYFPFPKGIIIEDYVNEKYKSFGARDINNIFISDDDNETEIFIKADYPNGMAMGLMGASGNFSKKNVADLLYGDSDGDGNGVIDMIKDAKREGKTHPFSGVYFYWF